MSESVVVVGIFTFKKDAALRKLLNHWFETSRGLVFLLYSPGCAMSSVMNLIHSHGWPGRIASIQSGWGMCRSGCLPLVLNCQRYRSNSSSIMPRRASKDGAIASHADFQVCPL